MMNKIFAASLLALAGCTSSGSGGAAGPGLPTPQGFSVKISFPAEGAVTGPTVNLAFKTSDASADFQCTLDGFVLPCTPTGISTQILPGGSHTFTVKGTLDGVEVTDQVTWTVDDIGPTISIVSPTSAHTASTGTITLTTDDAVQFLCFFDGGAGFDCNSGDIFQGLSSGPHILEVIGYDDVNNAGATQSVTFTVN